MANKRWEKLGKKSKVNSGLFDLRRSKHAMLADPTSAVNRPPITNDRVTRVTAVDSKFYNAVVMYNHNGEADLYRVIDVNAVKGAGPQSESAELQHMQTGQKIGPVSTRMLTLAKIVAPAKKS